MLPVLLVLFEMTVRDIYGMATGVPVVHYPACLSEVIAVGSIDSDGTKSSFSNYGQSECSSRQ